MGLSRGESQDVALDAMAIAYDRWSKISKLPYRDAWTLKMTANLALRQAKRRHRDAGLPADPLRPSDPNMASRLELRDALSRLSRRQREVIFLPYLADLPESEVAAVLGIDIGSVKQHASRGRQALKHDLALLDGGDGRVE
jgi:RNA polymerase sigma factor (sigma-70 family)